MTESDALFRTVLASPDDADARLVYADWLDDHDRPGGAYLRAEVAVARGASDRLALLRHFVALPADVQNRVTQPDFLLAPPAPFRPAWYQPHAKKPTPYRKVPNLPAEAFDPKLPWLSGNAVPRTDEEDYEKHENEALAEVRARAKKLKLKLPPGFESLAKDFPRRNAISAASVYEFYLHDAVIEDFPPVGDGFVVLFSADMNYGANPQLSWGLYLVPKVAWHCVVTFQLGADDGPLFPTKPAKYLYAAPSFQAFLYRSAY